MPLHQPSPRSETAPRSALVEALALPLALSALSGCGGQEAQTGDVGRGVLVIAIDGLRADHLSVAGFDYDRETTPVLAQLAHDGVSFTQTISTAPLLIPAHISLLTGCDPNIALRSQDIRSPSEQRWNLPSCTPSLAVEFLAGGYSTIALADHAELAPVYGIDAGFQRFDEFDPYKGHLSSETGMAGLRPPLEQWLRERETDEPWFAYLQTNDLERNWHYPIKDPGWEGYFEARPELSRVPPVAHTDPAFFAIPRGHWLGGNRTLGGYEARYDGALRYVDEQIGALVHTLQELGRLEQTTICVVGSFGLQFGEDGLYIDHGRYSAADLHVPWILKPAAGGVLHPTRNRRIDGIASLSDVAPTLLELEGLRVPEGMHGMSQVAGLPTGSSMRQFAFASCGLQQGYVALDDTYTLEVILPGQSRTEELGLGWYGEGTEHIAHEERFYERASTPTPSLVEVYPAPPRLADELREWSVGWVRAIDLTRRVMQESTPLHSPVEAAEKQALVAAGYLGEDC